MWAFFACWKDAEPAILKSALLASRATGDDAISTMFEDITQTLADFGYYDIPERPDEVLDYFERNNDRTRQFYIIKVYPNPSDDKDNSREDRPDDENNQVA